MDKKLNVGIIGCGTIARVHAQALTKSNNTTLNSVFSRTKKNAKAMGEEFNVKWYTDWSEFISDTNLTAVSICTPSGNHLDYGVLAASAGKHVIVEKPIEITIERAKKLINVCEDNKVALAVIYQSRFTPEIKSLNEKLKNDEIGKLFMGDAYIKWFRDQNYYDSGEWRGTITLDGGGTMINQAIHTIDLLQWFMGDIESIYGHIDTLTHERLEGEDNAVAVVRYKSGAMGIIQGSTSIQPAQARRIEIHGKNGTAILNGDKVSILKENNLDTSTNEKKGKSSGASSPLAGFSIEPHRHQFEAISDAIRKGIEPPVSGHESLKSLAIVMAIYESSKTNQSINMDEFIK